MAAQVKSVCSSLNQEWKTGDADWAAEVCWVAGAGLMSSSQAPYPALLLGWRRNIPAVPLLFGVVQALALLHGNHSGKPEAKEHYITTLFLFTRIYFITIPQLKSEKFLEYCKNKPEPEISNSI